LFKLARIKDIYWAIECISKPSFEQLFELAKITYIYWPIKCTPKPSFE
jgi:hypothetical protein